MYFIVSVYTVFRKRLKNVTKRVLSKLLGSPLERWRKDGVCVFIHLDDGLEIVRGRGKALRASKRVREDLDHYGLLASEEKSEWGARRNIL